MANEKILNTRIQLKYDSYANWTSTTLGDNKGANFVLKAGEIGICHLPTSYNEQQVVGSQPSQILFKVGDGVSKYSELPWASAKAADVYAWAKQASLPVTKEGTGNVVSGIAWDENTKGIKFTTASVATSEGLEQLTNRVGAIEKDYLVEKDLSDAVTEINAAIALKADKTYVDTELEKKVSVSDFNTFKTENTTAIGTAKSEAIAAAKTETESQVGALRDGAVKANADAITAMKDHASVDSFNDVMVEMAKYQLAGDYATKSEAQGYADAKDTAIAEAKKAGTDANAALEAYKTSNDKAVADNAAAIERLTNGVSQEEIDGVNDLIEYVNEHGPEVTQMKADISANAAAIAALNAADGKVANAEKADVASSLDEEAVAQVKGIVVDNAAKAADADTLNGHDSTYFATAAQGAKADTAVQPAALNDYYTKTQTDAKIDEKIIALDLANTYDAKGAASTAESNAKAYADSLAGNYATIAQGAKADSALQSIAAGTGLKVSTKADNSQTIDIDDTVVFVFECGSSTEVM